eukprot:6136776-Alexandrium_andersonii.AAC.1
MTSTKTASLHISRPSGAFVFLSAFLPSTRGRCGLRRPQAREICALCPLECTQRLEKMQGSCG